MSRGWPRHLFGLPLHPMLVHFPLVLWLCLPVFDALAIAFPEGPYWRLALGFTAAGVLVGTLAVLTGLLDYIHLSDSGSNDVRLASRHGVRTGMVWLVMLIKLVFALLLAATPALRWSCLVVDLLAALLLLQGVWFGTAITYARYRR